jgi:hypothetical protein
VKYRISTITGSPGSGTVRRMTRSGLLANVDPAGGDLHPSMQDSEGSPLFGGGVSGSAGGVGEARVGVEGKGFEVEGAGELGKLLGPPSQAARTTISAATIMRFFMRCPSGARRG